MASKEKKISLFGGLKRLANLDRRIIFFILAVFAIIAIAVDLRLILRLTQDDYYPISTLILDRHGKLIYEIFTEKRRTPVELSDLPPHIKQATIAIEDKDFYRHFGFDPIGVVRAIRNTLLHQRLEGGSTITQQLVKTTLLTPERTLPRKVREFYLALVLEIIYSKDKILELYLNQVPYGGTAYGIEAAALTYFGKSAKELTLSQAALLAGLPAAPTRFSPFGVNPNLAKERQIAVLRRMVEDGYISQVDADKANLEELHFRQPKGAAGIHFALWVKEQLVEEYGERAVEQGGLRVTTTLDLPTQKHAEEIVKAEVDRLKRQKVKNGAALVTHPKTGEILAMVGSKDYFASDEDGKVNVTQAPRQPGSAIKPVNYALGLTNRKVTPASVFLDTPTCFDVLGQPIYCPLNYDGAFRGPIELREALANSINIPAVKMLAKNGVPEFVTFAQKMGLSTISDPSRYGLSLTLGGGEVKMTDMAVAFGTFANEGVKQDLVSILEVKDWQDKTLEKTEFGQGERIITQEVAFLISDILSDNSARSAVFGTSSFLNVLGHPEVSVKTGTTNDRRDNWTIGYTKDAVVASWVGNNDNTPMGGAVSGVSGASPIWNRITKVVLDRIEKGEIGGLNESSSPHEHPFPEQPQGIKEAHVCALGNVQVVQVETPGPVGEAVPTCVGRTEYFIEGTEGQGAVVERRGVHIDRTTGQLITQNSPPENWEMQEHTVVFDSLGNMYCLDCTPPSEPILIRYPIEFPD